MTEILLIIAGEGDQMYTDRLIECDVGKYTGLAEIYRDKPGQTVRELTRAEGVNKMVNFALEPLASTSSTLAANNEPAGTVCVLESLPMDHSDRNVINN